MRINFDFGDLEAFLAVCELGSFQRAAEQLSLSQSALTRRIQKLEDGLGIVLLERTTRSMSLTLAAREFRAHAQSMLEEAQRAIRAVGDGVDRQGRRINAIVTVAAVPTATHKILPNAISAFRARGHTARIRISDLSANDVLESVAKGEADFGINFIGAQEPGLSFNVLMQDRFVLAMPRGDPLARRRTIRWRDVDEDRFIAVWKGSGNRMLVDSALARAGRTLDWSVEVRHLTTALGLVATGVGITALPASAVPDKDHPLVVSRPLVDPDVSRSIGTVRRVGGVLTPAAEAFYKVLHAVWQTSRAA